MGVSTVNWGGERCQCFDGLTGSRFRDFGHQFLSLRVACRDDSGRFITEFVRKHCTIGKKHRRFDVGRNDIRPLERLSKKRNMYACVGKKMQKKRKPKTVKFPDA